MYQAEDVTSDFTVTVVDERADSFRPSSETPRDDSSDDGGSSVGDDDELIEECPRLFSILDLSRVAGQTVRNLTDAGTSLLNQVFLDHFPNRPPLLLTWHQGEQPTKLLNSSSLCKLLPYQRLRRTPRVDNEVHQLTAASPLKRDDDGEQMSKKVKIESCHDDADTLPPVLKKQRREESMHLSMQSPLRSPLRCGSSFQFCDGGELAPEPCRQKRQREIASN